MNEDIRWKQRFENFGKALATLQEMIADHEKNLSSRAYEIAVVAAFQFTFELGWKTLKDYMNYGGTARDTIKNAFNSELITDGQIWIDMLDDRNILAHSYDQKKALAAVNNIKTRYINAIEQVHSLLQEKWGQ